MMHEESKINEFLFVPLAGRIIYIQQHNDIMQHDIHVPIYCDLIMINCNCFDENYYLPYMHVRQTDAVMR